MKKYNIHEMLRDLEIIRYKVEATAGTNEKAAAKIINEIEQLSADLEKYFYNELEENILLASE